MVKPVEYSNWRVDTFCARLIKTEFVQFNLRLTKGGGRINVYWRWQSDIDTRSYALGYFTVNRPDSINLTWLIAPTLVSSNGIFKTVINDVQTAWQTVQDEVPQLCAEIRQEWKESRPNAD